VTALPRSLDLAARLFRACPQGVRGKGRLARGLLGRFLDRTDVELRSRSGDVFLVPQLREPVAFELLIHGDYEPQTRRFILHHLPAGGTFVDVGANVGVFAVPAARHVGPAGRVLAVEASPRVFRYLEHNVHRNGVGNVTARACAAHDHDEESVAFWDAPADHFGMGSLAPQFHANPGGVPARTLDRLLAETGLDRADVLKVDVEGFEAEVFRGAKRLLTGPRPPVVLFEFCDWAEARGGKLGAAQQVLRDYGYRLHRLGGPEVDGVLTSGFEMLVARRDGVPAA
jgi:FkbM family methyltransferase